MRNGKCEVERTMQVQNTTAYYSPYSSMSVNVASTTSTAPNQNTYAADTYQTNNGNSDQAPGLDPNKQAGSMQRLMHGIGNAFGRMADWVGLGTISHYAKENFQAYDADKSNSLDAQEFTAVSQMVSLSLEQVDQNANQQVSFGEFKKIIGAIVDADYAALDTSGDGFVNYAEASTAGYVVIHGVNDSFVEHDINQDGLLSRNEFAGLVNDMKIRRKYG